MVFVAASSCTRVNSACHITCVIMMMLCDLWVSVCLCLSVCLFVCVCVCVCVCVWIHTYRRTEDVCLPATFFKPSRSICVHMRRWYCSERESDRDRQTDTHTHTHRERERERERGSLLQTQKLNPKP